jgi:hypothetical protein
MGCQLWVLWRNLFIAMWPLFWSIRFPVRLRFEFFMFDLNVCTQLDGTCAILPPVVSPNLGTIRSFLYSYITCILSIFSNNARMLGRCERSIRGSVDASGIGCLF